MLSTVLVLALSQVVPANPCGSYGKVCPAYQFKALGPSNSQTEVCLANSDGTTPAYGWARASQQFLFASYGTNACTTGATTLTKYDSATKAWDWPSLTASGSFGNSTAGVPFNFSDAEGVRVIGVATGSFATCVAGLAGTWQYDTTLSQFAWCDGTAWRYLPTGAAIANFENSWTGKSIGVAASSEDQNFLGPFTARLTSQLVQAVSCSWGVVGVGGSTGVVVQVYDTTASAVVCSCTLGACTTAVTAPLSCTCGGTMNAATGHVYAFRLANTTDCATNPGEIVCVATLTKI